MLFVSKREIREMGYYAIATELQELTLEFEKRSYLGDLEDGDLKEFIERVIMLSKELEGREYQLKNAVEGIDLEVMMNRAVIKTKELKAQMKSQIQKIGSDYFVELSCMDGEKLFKIAKIFVDTKVTKVVATESSFVIYHEK